MSIFHRPSSTLSASSNSTVEHCCVTKSKRLYGRDSSCNWSESRCGKGIALALGDAGALVYVTGRSIADGDSPYGGTVSETADLVTRAGGEGIAIALDHADDEAVAALFARIKAEHWSTMPLRLWLVPR
jgi:hypothetical protein